jgi:hypothetical protein
MVLRTKILLAAGIGAGAGWSATGKLPSAGEGWAAAINAKNTTLGAMKSQHMNATVGHSTCSYRVRSI